MQPDRRHEALSKMQSPIQRRHAEILPGRRHAAVRAYAGGESSSDGEIAVANCSDAALGNTHDSFSIESCGRSATRTAQPESNFDSRSDPDRGAAARAGRHCGVLRLQTVE